MDLSQLHFAYPLWLWGGLVIPLIWLLFFFYYRSHQPSHQLETFIDRHLLPYLLQNASNKKKSLWKPLLLWSIVWLCLTVALAGPRWSFREMETFSRDQSLVVLLDLSESMNATDVNPSRLVRAKQKIEDLINLSKGIKIGLIAFAADPHMMTPITDDKETIRHLLPSLDTDLVSVQGSRLSSALEMASTMLAAEPGNNQAILVISDGGFEDASAIATAKKLAERGIVIHAMGVGTLEGAPLQDHAGNVIKKNGALIISKLEKERLNEINKAGNGRYLDAHYSDQEVTAILKELEKRAEAQLEVGKKHRFWEEQFYLLLIPVLPMFLWWFRRGALFSLTLLLFSPSFELEAMTLNECFKNSEELGKQALDEGDYDSAVNRFQDPYRKGVVYYKMGDFAEAEKMFRESCREDVACNATYNLGNTLVQQQKLKEAVAAYEDVLTTWPDHIKAKENLELVKKMLEEQKQEGSNSEDGDQKDDREEKGSENENQGEQQDSDGSDQKESQQNEQQQGNDSPDGQERESQQPEEGQESQIERGEDGDREQEEPQGGQETDPTQDEQEPKACKSQEEQDADLWLNQIENDPKVFLKNKFYIESKKNGTAQGVDPW